MSAAPTNPLNLAQSVIPQITALDTALNAAGLTLSNAAEQLSNDRDAQIQAAATAQAALATANTVTIPGLQSQLKAAQGGQVRTVTSPVTLPANATSVNDTYLSPVITAAQSYGLITSSGCTIINLTASGGSGGARFVGDGLNVRGGKFDGCGQDGFDVYATNSVFSDIEASGNNKANFAAYNQGGGCKVSKSTACQFNNLNIHDNFGNGFWTDVGCQNITINGGVFSNSMVSGANAADQVSPIRIELTNGFYINGVAVFCAPKQNTALEICDSANGIVCGGKFGGQIGIVNDNRPTYAIPGGPTIDTSLDGLVFIGVTVSSVYFPAGMKSPPTWIGTKFTASPGQPVAYVGSTALALAEFQQQFDPKASLASA
jgi:hypothetical protein